MNNMLRVELEEVPSAKYHEEIRGDVGYILHFQLKLILKTSSMLKVSHQLKYKWSCFKHIMSLHY